MQEQYKLRQLILQPAPAGAFRILSEKLIIVLVIALYMHIDEPLYLLTRFKLEVKLAADQDARLQPAL